MFEADFLYTVSLHTIISFAACTLGGGKLSFPVPVIGTCVQESDDFSVWVCVCIFSQLWFLFVSMPASCLFFAIVLCYALKFGVVMPSALLLCLWFLFYLLCFLMIWVSYPFHEEYHRSFDWDCIKSMNHWLYMDIVCLFMNIRGLSISLYLLQFCFHHSAIFLE